MASADVESRIKAAQSPVQELVGRVDAAMGEQRSVIDGLRERLDIVLRPEQDLAEPRSMLEAATPLSTSTHVDELRRLERAVEENTGRLRRILDLLDV